ncbi:initiation factor, subunit 2 family protein [Teladorsagia circumcincta]|uniref:Translation initiation factor eIF2B subunit delta n=1 Tax=Teladorsagia circumcincta TaxID=45464 RepID=A0A2G9UV25_TELCI|nr:initiation factor, subunit 2 family protein [Teladorsagia circumcincta]
MDIITAEAAAAKKAAEGEQGKVQHSKYNESSKGKRAVEKLTKAVESQNGAPNDSSQPQVARVGKSALRGDGKHQPVREVKFVPVGPCSECPEPPSTAHIHPAFLNLTVRCELGMIDEVDSLCLNFLGAFKEYLADWVSQRQKENRDPSSLSHDLDVAIRPQIAYLTQESRWPLPYALGNIVRQLKKEIMKMGTPDRSGNLLGAESVKKWLDDCEEEYFGSAYRAISDYLLGKMKTSPNVITYDWCPVVNRVLLDAVEKDYEAIFTVVDPEMEGKGLRHIQSFIERKVRCRYTDLNSVGAVMKNGSMVLLGCAAVLSNGCVVAPKGSMLVALTAKAYNVPVLILSQTFKFVDKVQGGGRVALLNRESMELVPSDLITAIVTDIRVLPPSSAPAVLKAKALDLE